jgi:hypothetical protein
VTDDERAELVARADADAERREHDRIVAQQRRQHDVADIETQRLHDRHLKGLR